MHRLCTYIILCPFSAIVTMVLWELESVHSWTHWQEGRFLVFFAVVILNNEGEGIQIPPKSGPTSARQRNAIENRDIIGPPAKRHFNGVSLAGRWWPNIECWLCTFVILQGVCTSIAKKPIALWFFRGCVRSAHEWRVNFGNVFGKPILLLRWQIFATYICLLCLKGGAPSSRKIHKKYILKYSTPRKFELRFFEILRPWKGVPLSHTPLIILKIYPISLK